MIDAKDYYRAMGWTGEDCVLIVCDKCGAEHFVAKRMWVKACDICKQSFLTHEDVRTEDHES